MLNKQREQEQTKVNRSDSDKLDSKMLNSDDSTTENSAAGKILIVEDEAKIAALLKDYLTQSAFECQWLARGDEVMPWLAKNQVSLILLDLMLPGMDGFEVCKQVRAEADIPIIMLTARVEEIDRLIGLEIGADDYVCKPFSPREIVARVKTVLRRTLAQTANSKASIKEPLSSATEELSLDENSFRLSYGTDSCQLTKIESRILSALQRYPGRIYSRNQLMDQIYDDQHVVSDRTIDSHVKKLRRKINSLGASDNHVQSVYGTGYKFEPNPAD